MKLSTASFLVAVCAFPVPASAQFLCWLVGTCDLGDDIDDLEDDIDDLKAENTELKAANMELYNLMAGIVDPNNCIADDAACDWESTENNHALDAKCCSYDGSQTYEENNSYYGCFYSQCGELTCFPGDALVETKARGIIRMNELQAGDQVRSRTGFSKVYGFGHRLVDDSASYFKFTTNASEQDLEISGLHQVFVGRNGATKYAKDVVVGDELVLENKIFSKVSKIESVQKQGIYQPYTNDGTIVVNGAMASNYCESATVNVLGMEMIDMHSFKYMVYAPARLLCGLSQELCTHQVADGRLVYNAWVKKVLSHMLPGYLQGETPSFLDTKAPYFMARVAFLIFWIVPVFALEQVGVWAAMMVAVCASVLFVVRKSKAHKSIV